MRADQTIDPKTSSRMPASGVALCGGCLELWHEQDIQLTRLAPYTRTLSWRRCFAASTDMRLCVRKEYSSPRKGKTTMSQLRAGRRRHAKPNVV